MAKTNKHKATGTTKKVQKESWWTPERVKAVISICVVVIIVAIGVGVYKYMSDKQDSVVGVWRCDYQSAETGEDMAIIFTFNEVTSSGLRECSFVRTRSGEEEAQMSGQYSVDEEKHYLTTMLGDDLSEVAIYSYTCKDGKLSISNIESARSYEFEKVTE